MYEKETKLIEGMYPEILKVAEEVTGFCRGSMYLPGLAQTAAYLTEKMKQLGCEVEEQPDAKYGSTLIFRKKGRGKMKVLFYAHMDTVWKDPACQEPFRIEGGRAYGAGISDCTHGLLASIYTLKALNALGMDNYGELIIVFNPDEEETSPSSSKWLKEYSRDMDLAICMEGPEAADLYTTARAGSAYYEIRISGKMAHAGVNPEEGANALEEMTFKLNEILQKKFNDVYLVLTWIKGGSGDCCVSDNAYAMLRYRIKTWDAKPEIDAYLKEMEGKTFVPGTSTSITFWPEGGFGPMPRLPWVDKFAKIVDTVSAELNYPLHEGYGWGGCDAASTVLNCPTLDGIAPATFGCHMHGENLLLESIVPRITILTVLMEKVCSDDQYLRER